MRAWQPASEVQPQEPTAEDGSELTANEKIQQRMAAQAAERTWPATWNGREHTAGVR